MADDEQHNPQRGLGRGMLIIGWLAALGVLTMLFGQQEASWTNPNRDPVVMETRDGATEVVLRRNRYDQYITSGFINGKEVTFLLDTGATDVVVPESMAERLGLLRGARHQAVTANGTIDIYDTHVESLRVGAILLRDVDASINPYMDDSAILLGMSALGEIEFTQSGDTLTLRYRG